MKIFSVFCCCCCCFFFIWFIVFTAEKKRVSDVKSVIQEKKIIILICIRKMRANVNFSLRYDNRLKQTSTISIIFVSVYMQMTHVLLHISLFFLSHSIFLSNTRHNFCVILSYLFSFFRLRFIRSLSSTSLIFC